MAQVINLHYHEGQPAFDFLDMAGTMKPVFFGMSLGKAVDPARVPTYAREKTRNKKLYDIFSMPGLNGVSQRFRDLVEEFEPGVHQFFPLQLSRRDGTPIEGNHYVFNCFVRADTVLVDRSGLSWGESAMACPMQRRGTGSCFLSAGRQSGGGTSGSKTTCAYTGSACPRSSMR